MSGNDRSWMYRRVDPNGAINLQFEYGVDSFIQFAKAHGSMCMNGPKIRCPCRKCKNMLYQPEPIIKVHLCGKGFIDNYKCWDSHGEKYVSHRGIEEPVSNQQPALVVDPIYDGGDDHMDNVESSQRERFQDMIGIHHSNTAENLHGKSKKLYELLETLDQPLYEGSSVSKLETLAKLLNGKVDGNMTQNAYDIMVGIFKDILPPNNKLDGSFRETKNALGGLALPLVKIDACRNHCMLFYKDGDENLRACKHCKADRYKLKRKSGKGKPDTPYRQLHYLPIGPRLQQLYSLPDTAEAMKWHKGCCRKEGEMSHPSDGEAWKHFDNHHPSFAADPRNVRLCLSSDGFTPFNNLAKPYSMWPVIVTPLNLPPWLCMTDQFMFLNLLIPGDKSPGKSIDVYLQPLIDELKLLWNDGIRTFDSSCKQIFQMKAALMWTISDFPAYGMLSGWSTHGKLACHVCMGQTKGFSLPHGHKVSFFDCHRCFLPDTHVFRSDRSSFTKGKEERRAPPRRLTGEEVLVEVSRLPPNQFGQQNADRRPEGFGLRHNWTKKSVFWELPYWSTNLVRHMLDVMHIEKNFFDNIFNTIMDVKGKTKDNKKARLDLPSLCRRPRLHLTSSGAKPNASYFLNQEKKMKVMEWVEGLRLPDGYSSNLRARVDKKKCCFSAIKSHDCHVFLQRLLPIALREMLPKDTWGPITEVSEFFRCLCASSLNVEHLKDLEESFVVTLCKLEKLFPPSFFDSMEHLAIHLAYEARVGGPVQYRWMYPFERFLNRLKKKVKNMAAVESSITEAVIVEEVATFIAHYLRPEVRSRLNKVIRNDDSGGELRADSDKKVSVFTPPGRFLRRSMTDKVFLQPRELNAASLYVIMNCPELSSYVRQYEAELKESFPNYSAEELLAATDAGIHQWLKDYVSAHPDDPELGKCKHLFMGPNCQASVYKGYFVNGYAFRNRDDDAHRATSHSGVCLKGRDDYYGVLRDVVELEYLGHDNKVVLFRCDWFDSVNGVHKHDTYNIVDVDINSKHQGDDVFILASDAEQAYFAPYPHLKKTSNTSRRSRREWCAVWKTKARRNIDIQYVTTPFVRGSSSLDLCFQENEMPIPPAIVVDGVKEDAEIPVGEEGPYEEPDPFSQFIHDSANIESDASDIEHDESDTDSDGETEDEFQEDDY